MKRHAPEESRESNPLFDRVEVGIARAVNHAERIEQGWRASAVEAVRLYARTHDTFLSEDVRKVMSEPDGSDGRAWGAVMRDAERAGYITAGPAVRDQWGSWKTCWRSLIR